MKRRFFIMKKLLALVLSMLLVASCFALVVAAEEETTAAEETTVAEETTEGEAVTYSNTLITFNDQAKEWKIISSPNGINKTFYKSEWEGARLEIKDVGDPYVTIAFSNYIKKAQLDKLDSEAYPYIAFKLKVDGYIDDIELFVCAGTITGPTPDYATTTAYPCECSGEVEYIIYDLSAMGCEGNYNQFRFDPMGADEETAIYLYEMAFFATEEEAIAYAGFDQEETEEETEAETEAKTEAETEEKTEATTKKPATTTKVEDEKSGCGSVISIGAVVAIISLGVVCIKKKD